MTKGLPLTREVSQTHSQVGVVTRGQLVTVAEETAPSPPPALDEGMTRTNAVEPAADNLSVPTHVALDQVSDKAFEQEYRRRYLHGRSSTNRSFNQDEYYKHALSNDPPARSDSAATTPTWFTPAIPRMQAAGGGGSGGGGGGGGDGDDDDDARGPPSDGSGRGFSPHDPSGPPMMTHPTMAPMRMNVIMFRKQNVVLV